MWRILLFLLLLPVVTEGAGDAALDRATLRDLKSISVVIDRIDPELVKEGFAEGILRGRIEDRLQNAGLPVTSKSTEFLGLRLLHVRGRRGPYALCVSLGLYQPVILVRDAKVRTATQTWEVNTVLMAEPSIVYSASLDSVDELVDRFIAAWRAVNQP
jgi:hypothetical protein